MLYLEIQRGKEGKKTLPHNATMGATAGCTLGLLEGLINGSCLVRAFILKSLLKKIHKDASGGVSVVLTGIAPNGVWLIAVCFSYSVKTTLFFVMTENSGSTKPGNPYVMKYTDSYGNICLRE
jgi:hypothetical protein